MNHNKKPLKLTIVIPAYNEEINLKRCLESVARQEVMPSKVIVVDNNSTDNTARIARQYKFVEVIKEPKQGIAHARNRGFNAVHSGIIARIDADTTLPPNWVKNIRQHYENPAHQSTALTGGGYFTNLTFPSKKFTNRLHSLIAFRFNRLIMGHYILWGSNMALLANQWRLVKGDVCNDSNIHEDLDLAIHLHRRGVKIAYDPSLQVGVVMKRVLDDWGALRSNMLWWPNTLKHHNNRRWVFGYIGANFLIVLSVFPVLFNKPAMFLRPKYSNYSELRQYFRNLVR